MIKALYLLLQCGYNSEEGLRRRRMNAVPPADTMSLWSEEECRAFELGLRLYGKDFHMIQQQKVGIIKAQHDIYLHTCISTNFGQIFMV